MPVDKINPIAYDEMEFHNKILSVRYGNLQ